MLKNSEILRFLSQSIPIVLIICYLLFPLTFVDISKTILGKIIAVMVICVYSVQDVFHGLLICLLIILYYHQEVEGFTSKSTEEYAKHIPKPSKKSNMNNLFEDHLEKDFTSVSFAYPKNISAVKKSDEAIFRKEKCHNSKVTYKNQNMKNQMITHVYPELQFMNEECNPCDPTCHFTVNKKQNVESTLKPLSSHSTILDNIKNLFGMKKNEPFLVNKKMVSSEYV